MGQDVGIVDLTQGELGTRGTVEIRRAEAEASAKLMGLKVRRCVGMADGFFRNDEEHQRMLIPFIRHYQPDIVLANALEDRHPDHGRGGRLIADACFLAGLRMIETKWDGVVQEPWRPRRVYHFIQDRLLQPHFIVDISGAFEKKMEAIRCFKSQFNDPGSGGPQTYISTGNFLDQIKYKDALYGKRIGTAYGEGFTTENIPGIGDLSALVLPDIP